MSGKVTRTALLLVRDLLHLVVLTCTSHTSLAAENLFLRKQLAFYVERNIRPRRLDNAARVALVVLARVIDWRQLLTVVQPEALVRWHRQGSAYSGAGSRGARAVPGFLPTSRR
jgi:putative transposase